MCFQWNTWVLINKMSKNMKSLISKRYFLTAAVSSLLSIFMVAVVAYGATVTISSVGVGSGSSTPGAAIGAKGGIIADDFVYASSLVATSSLTVTSFGATGATSTIRYGFVVATTSLAVDGFSGAVTIGTSTVPNSDIPNTSNSFPSFTVSGVGGAYQATGTIYAAGGGANGGEILLKSTDGNNCVSLMATTGALDPLTDTASTQDIAKLLSARVVACPR